MTLPGWKKWRQVAAVLVRGADVGLIAGAAAEAADSAISRRGSMDRGLGKLRRRNLHFEVPVREPGLWNPAPVERALTETPSFLSDDSYDFDFSVNAAHRRVDRYLSFGEARSFDAGDVVLFSGGLDSPAGALDALMARRTSVVLVTWRSFARISSGLYLFFGLNPPPRLGRHQRVDPVLRAGQWVATELS